MQTCSERSEAIPLVDLKRQYSSIEKDIDLSIKRVLNSGQFILGTEVSSLEKEAAEYIGVKYAIGVASGTDALHLSLLACGVGEGDEVITTSFTFIATAEAVSYCGAKPVFADIDIDTYNIDPSKIEEKITEKTKAIIPVHLYGRAADMDRIMEIAEKYKLKVIEDCAQSFGTEYKNKKTGGIGNAGAFSFFPSKNLGGYGDGGMVVTDDGDIAEKVRMLRAHGSRQKYIHQVIGYNSRLDEIQAAILRIKLKKIDMWNEMRRKHAVIYNSLLKGLPVKLSDSNNREHIYHVYTIRIKKRDDCIKFLSENGISSAVHYPVTIPAQEAYKHLGYKESDLPNSYQAAREVLSLPMFPEMEKGEIETICKAIKRFIETGNL
ncbi:MAG: DegT/DnrJ/EryC1/StrS family aminotransferase [Nitrospinae bacterium]|nr:DegT/DnrJ/EryC1/StrS family aminotransferase [Nitrospinota bacterium]MBI3815881.1 DegT/DnrJ/EryC1/StrS family aminotransferase [Nitrospinota bacterium]